MPHVFISYVKENRQQVERLCRDLREYGIDYWLDREKIKPGEKWKDAIRQAIKEGAFFIACFSRESMEKSSTFMNEELTLAIAEMRKHPTNRVWFIPVLLTGEASIPDLEIGAGNTLRDFQWVDLSEDWEGERRKIIAVIHDTPLERVDEKLFGGALRDGERDLFQLLLKEKDISLSRSDKGSALNVTFEIITKKITHRDRKDFIKSTIPGFESNAIPLQKELDDFLIERIGRAPQTEKKDFKFRYASGGVLPILHLEGHDYYCLFYRDVYPIGWNIANGSTTAVFP